MNNDKTDIFAYATRRKIRFSSTKGDLTVEQLWDVPLRSTDGFNLDAIAKTANQAFKAATEESFVTSTVSTPVHRRLLTTLDVVKAIIESKLAEEEEVKKQADNKKEREKLLAILAEKQEGKLSKLSEQELQRRIAALET